VQCVVVAFALRCLFGSEIELCRPDGGTDLIAWSDRLSLPLEGMPSSLTTDGAFVWLRTDPAGEAIQCFLLGGSFVERDGRWLYEGTRRETKIFAT